MSRRIFTLAFLITALPLCAQNVVLQNTYLLDAESRTSVPGSPPAELRAGLGFNTLRGDFASFTPCADVQTLSEPDAFPERAVEITLVKRSDSLFDALQLNGAATFAGGAGSAKLESYHQIKRSAYETLLLVRARTRYPARPSLFYPRLSKFGQSAWNKDKTKTKEQFFATCGNSFVAGVGGIAEVTAMLRVESKDEDERTSLEAQMKVVTGTFTTEVGIKSATEKLSSFSYTEVKIVEAAGVPWDGDFSIQSLSRMAWKVFNATQQQTSQSEFILGRYSGVVTLLVPDYAEEEVLLKAAAAKREKWESVVNTLEMQNQDSATYPFPSIETRNRVIRDANKVLSRLDAAGAACRQRPWADCAQLVSFTSPSIELSTSIKWTSISPQNEAFTFIGATGDLGGAIFSVGCWMDASYCKGKLHCDGAEMQWHALSSAGAVLSESTTFPSAVPANAMIAARVGDSPGSFWDNSPECSNVRVGIYRTFQYKGEGGSE